MISGISSSSAYLTVIGGTTSVPYISPGAQSAGMMRYNTSTNTQEVYNGTSWVELRGSHATIELNGHTQAILRWAEHKMVREQRLQELAEKHESVRAALSNVADAEEKLDIIVALAAGKQ